MNMLKNIHAGLQELQERVGEQLRVAHALDVYRANGAFLVSGLFAIILFSIGASVCAIATEPTTFEAMLFFLGVMFALLTLILHGNASSKRKIISLLRSGKTSEATITKRMA